MEAVAMASSLSVFSKPRCSFQLPSQPFCLVKPFYSKNTKTKQLVYLSLVLAKQRRHQAWRCSASESSSSPISSERWLLEPVGDGDSRHIGYRVRRPGAFEIASNAVTVGRLPEKADIVLDVATVSGVHARLEKKDGNLLVTDLDSTNGTYIDDQKLRPGAITPVKPGSCLIFGDTNLAIFRVSRIKVDTTSESNGTQAATEPDVSAATEPDVSAATEASTSEAQ